MVYILGIYIYILYIFIEMSLHLKNFQIEIILVTKVGSNSAFYVNGLRYYKCVNRSSSKKLYTQQYFKNHNNWQKNNEALFIATE